MASQTLSPAQCYQILELPATATEQDVKSAYRRLVNQYHPDKNREKSDEEIKSAKEKFNQVALAYKTLREVVRGQSSRSQPNSKNGTPPKSEPSKPGIRITVIQADQKTDPDKKPTSSKPSNSCGYENQKSSKSTLLERFDDLLKGGNWQQVLQEVEELTTDLQNDQDVCAIKARTYHASARHLFYQGKYELAIVQIQKALQTDPSRQAFWKEIEYAYRQKQQQKNDCWTKNELSNHGRSKQSYSPEQTAVSSSSRHNEAQREAATEIGCKLELSTLLIIAVQMLVGGIVIHHVLAMRPSSVHQQRSFYQQSSITAFSHSEVLRLPLDRRQNL
jgi:curved DNA-binding protein CbpA